MFARTTGPTTIAEKNISAMTITKLPAHVASAEIVGCGSGSPSATDGVVAAPGAASSVIAAVDPIIATPSTVASRSLRMVDPCVEGGAITLTF
jgi:hypothetical protein